jgi:hypothetical protein
MIAYPETWKFFPSYPQANLVYCTTSGYDVLQETNAMKTVWFSEFELITRLSIIRNKWLILLHGLLQFKWTRIWRSVFPIPGPHSGSMTKEGVDLSFRICFLFYLSFVY